MNKTQATRTPFKVKDSFPEGVWRTDVNRFHRLAHKFLDRLIVLTEKVANEWPAPKNQTLNDAEVPKSLLEVLDERDSASDIARMYAAMSVEAFLNFYGATRLGESIYKDHFERLGIVPKARKLLLVCDLINVAETDPIIKTLNTVFNSRNLLAHPKAHLETGSSCQDRFLTPIPGEAKEVVEAMDVFFREFEAISSQAIHLTPSVVVKNA